MDTSNDGGGKQEDDGGPYEDYSLDYIANGGSSDEEEDDDDRVHTNRKGENQPTNGTLSPIPCSNYA